MVKACPCSSNSILTTLPNLVPLHARTRQAGLWLFIVPLQTPGAQAAPTPRTELSRPWLSKNRAPSNTHSCETTPLGSPRDEAICGLSGLLRAAKGQALDPGVLGVRAPGSHRPVAWGWGAGPSCRSPVFLHSDFLLQRETGRGGVDRGCGISVPRAHEHVRLRSESIRSRLGAC